MVLVWREGLVSALSVKADDSNVNAFAKASSRRLYIPRSLLHLAAARAPSRLNRQGLWLNM